MSWRLAHGTTKLALTPTEPFRLAMSEIVHVAAMSAVGCSVWGGGPDKARIDVDMKGRLRRIIVLCPLERWRVLGRK